MCHRDLMDFSFPSAGEEVSTDDMPPLEGDAEEGDSSKMEEVD